LMRMVNIMPGVAYGVSQLFFSIISCVIIRDTGVQLVLGTKSSEGSVKGIVGVCLCIQRRLLVPKIASSDDDDAPTNVEGK